MRSQWVDADLVWSLLLEITYTRGTPFYDSEFTPGEFRVAFVLYANTLLSINLVTLLLNRTYKTIFEAINSMEAAFKRGFATIWEQIGHTITRPRLVDEIQRVCSWFKGQSPLRNGLSRGGSPEPGWTQ